MRVEPREMRTQIKRLEAKRSRAKISSIALGTLGAMFVMTAIAGVVIAGRVSPVHNFHLSLAGFEMAVLGFFFSAGSLSVACLLGMDAKDLKASLDQHKQSLQLGDIELQERT